MSNQYLQFIVSETCSAIPKCMHHGNKYENQEDTVPQQNTKVSYIISLKFYDEVNCKKKLINLQLFHKERINI